MWPGCHAQYPPLSLSAGGAENTCRRDNSRWKGRCIWSVKIKHSCRHLSQRGVDNRPQNYLLAPTYQGVHLDAVCLDLYSTYLPMSANMRPWFCPLPPPAIITMSLVIKRGEREVSRQAVGGEMTGQAFDEFSEINMLGGFGGGIKMSEHAKLLFMQKKN